MTNPTKLRHQAGTWALILALWVLLVLALSGALVFVRGVAWAEALNISLRNWYPWILLAPAVAWLGFRFPFERDRLKVSVPVHLAACIACAIIMEMLVGPPPARFGPLPNQGFRSPGPLPNSQQAPRRLGPAEPFEAQPPPNPLTGQWTPNGPQPPFPPVPVPGFQHRYRFLNALLIHAQMSVPVYWVIVSVVQALRFYQRSKDKERKAAELEARLAQAKLQALHMQLQPHFLFNTLNAISMLVHKDPHAADEMIANLSDLLRASLNTRSPEITLSQEMELVDKYLAIQQVRFADRLTIRKNLEAGALQQRVPALILQPLIENAVKHGLEPKPGPGKLEIHAAVQDGCLRIRVEDDGVGTANQGSENHGIGLANTRDRLRELYGPEARLVLTNCSPGGFSAQIIIPESSRKSAGTPS
jgi:signal transduction histidine kinase